MSMPSSQVLERDEQHGFATPEPEARLNFSAARLRHWGIQTTLSIVDQGLTAAAGFGVNLLLARWLSADAYGAFAVAFAGYLFVSGFHNVLLLEPLSVLGPARHASHLFPYFRAQIRAHFLLMGFLSLFVVLAGLTIFQLAPKNLLLPAVIGGGAALPLLLLLWLLRRMCYVLKRPAVAVLGSSVYLVVVIISLFADRRFHLVSPFSAFVLMGCGSLLSSLVLLQRFGLLRRTRPGHSASLWRNILRENWQYGRWLMGSAVLFPAASQLQTVLAAALLGLGSAGVLRAMQIPSLVMTQLITAIGLLVLPVFSYDFGRAQIQRLRRRAAFVSWSLALLTFLFMLLLIWVAVPTEHILFGGKYAAYVWLIPALALIPVMNGFAIGYSVALRASQKPHFDLLSNVIAAPIALVSAVLFMRWWGLSGAAASMVLGFAALSIATYVCFRVSRDSKPVPVQEVSCG
jgi:O-antigen/teichoic acid export membrane protein